MCLCLKIKTLSCRLKIKKTQNKPKHTEVMHMKDDENLSENVLTLKKINMQEMAIKLWWEHWGYYRQPMYVHDQADHLFRARLSVFHLWDWDHSCILQVWWQLLLKPQDDKGKVRLYTAQSPLTKVSLYFRLAYDISISTPVEYGCTLDWKQNDKNDGIPIRIFSFCQKTDRLNISKIELWENHQICKRQQQNSFM